MINQYKFPLEEQPYPDLKFMHLDGCFIDDYDKEVIDWLCQSSVVNQKVKNSFYEFEKLLLYVEEMIGTVDDLELFKLLFPYFNGSKTLDKNITNNYERMWMTLQLYGNYPCGIDDLYKRFPKIHKWLKLVNENGRDLEIELEFMRECFDLKFYTITSGYFNPVHKGHIECFNRAKMFSKELIVIVNNDEQVKLKGSKPFMDQEERMLIVGNLHAVNQVVLSIDEDKSVCETLKMIVSDKFFHKKIGIHEYNSPRFSFIKGGDRFGSEIPEARICEEFGIGMIDGQGQKIQSSSSLLGKV